MIQLVRTVTAVFNVTEEAYGNLPLEDIKAMENDRNETEMSDVLQELFDAEHMSISSVVLFVKD